MTKRHKHLSDPAPVFDDTGPSSSQTPYLVPSVSNVQIASLLSTGDQVGTKDGPAGFVGQPWRMAGIPDGLGVFDNGDGTMTVLMNNELPNTSGVPSEHGSSGAFVSSLTIDKATLQFANAGDEIQHVLVFDTATDQYRPATVAEANFNRFCSGDLAPVSAFFDAATGLGTTELIYLNGEENGPPFGEFGRAFAHVITGSEAGNSYELARFGNMAFENSLANPNSGAKTVVMMQDNSTPGEVYIYIGDKQSSGTTIEKAGLTNGKLFGISASFGDDTLAMTKPDSTFSLKEQGVNGDVSHLDGTALQNDSAPLTQFGRPEDGAWDPSNPNRYYFITTGL